MKEKKKTLLLFWEAGELIVRHLVDSFMGIVCLLNDFGLLDSKRDDGTFTGLDQGSLTGSLCTPTIRIDLGGGAGCAVQVGKGPPSRY